MKRKTFQPQEKSKRMKTVALSASMPNIEADEVLQRMREKDTEKVVPLKQRNSLKEIKRKAKVYELFSHLLSHLECEDYRDVEDVVLFFKADYMLDNVLLNLDCSDVAAVQKYCCTCFVLQWKFERVESSPDYYDTAIQLKIFNDLYDDESVEDLTKQLIRTEIRVLAAVQFEVEYITPYDFVLTLMCTSGLLHVGESDVFFKYQISKTLKNMLNCNHIRFLKAEEVAHLIIWLVRKKFFYLPLDHIKNMEEFYKTINV